MLYLVVKIVSWSCIVLKQKSDAWAVEPTSVGMPDLSMPTMLSQPRSIRWCATEAPTMPPCPMMTTRARSGNLAIWARSCEMRGILVGGPRQAQA